ncbi:MAG: serine hydrolase [Deltaproteobacteria bacterium]|nr:serine hydrolase [Deltaproteobacteria bacterium]
MSTPEEQGMHSDKLLQMLETIKERQIGVQSVAVMRNGYLVLDSYTHPYEDGQKHKMWSVTKSVTSALIGIAIDKGFIKGVDQKVVDFFQDKEISNLDDRKKSMTLQNLLTMTSGLQANDGWEKNWAGVFEMMKSNDWTQYALNLPMEATPGKRFEYYNCNYHLLSSIISKTTGMATIDFANMHLFKPLGIENVKWDTSPEGVNIGYDGLWLEPKEMAKIGLLYLNNGKWENKQIISSNWIKESITPYHDGRLLDQKYGYQWWINPAGYFSANGMNGQFIQVLPGKNLVAVFTSNIEGMEQFAPLSLFKDYISTAVASSESLPAKPEVTANLNAFVDKLTKASGEIITWKGENNGFAQGGVFKRIADPSFTFEYPVGCTKAELNNPDLQLMRMKTPEGVTFNASVVEIPDGMRLADFGTHYYAKLLEDMSSNIKVVSNKEITLKCGTKGYRSDIHWMWQDSWPLQTVLVLAYKNGKCIFVAAHPSQNPEKVAPIVQSLSCK